MASSTLGTRGSDPSKALANLGFRHGAAVQFSIDDPAAQHRGTGLIGLQVLDFASASEAVAFRQASTAGHRKGKTLPGVPGGVMWTYKNDSSCTDGCGGIVVFPVGRFFVNEVTQGTDESADAALAVQVGRSIYRAINGVQH